MIDTQPIFLIGGLDYDTEEKLGLAILGCNLLGLDSVAVCSARDDLPKVVQNFSRQVMIKSKLAGKPGLRRNSMTY